MASVFKTLLNNDITTVRNVLHESIPLTGALFSGTYGTWPNDDNVKDYSHRMFQSIYDYPYLSSSANQLFDVSVGYSNDSALSSSTNVQNDKKIQIYNQFAQVLMGHDHTGSIIKFDQDGDVLAGGTKMNECIFVSFSRLLTKDEIKKGSFIIQLGTGSYTSSFAGDVMKITDSHAINDYRVNSPVGEYAILTASSGSAVNTEQNKCGLLFYQAGIAVLSASIFEPSQKSGLSSGSTGASSKVIEFGSNQQAGGALTSLYSLTSSMTGNNIDVLSDQFRRRIYNIQFSNTTEINSQILFCRVGHNEFNYSANPTYLSGSKIRVKNNSFDEPVTYITTVGLYSADNELLAVAKLSEPLKKTPSNELILRVRMDF